MRASFALVLFFKCPLNSKHSYCAMKTIWLILSITAVLRYLVYVRLLDLSAIFLSSFFLPFYHILSYPIISCLLNLDSAFLFFLFDCECAPVSYPSVASCSFTNDYLLPLPRFLSSIPHLSFPSINHLFIRMHLLMKLDMARTEDKELPRVVWIDRTDRTKYLKSS